MSYQAKGKVVAIGDIQAFSNGFTKRDVVVDCSQNEKYVSPVPFQLKKDRCSLAEGLAIGDTVTVDFVVDGRAWTPNDGGKTKYFVDITALRIEKQGLCAPVENADPTEALLPGQDDLPF